MTIIIMLIILSPIIFILVDLSYHMWRRFKTGESDWM